MRFPMVPEGTDRPASFPSICATCFCSRSTVGSTPKTSSSTSAAAMAGPHGGVGTGGGVDRRSTVRRAAWGAPCGAWPPPVCPSAAVGSERSMFMSCRSPEPGVTAVTPLTAGRGLHVGTCFHPPPTVTILCASSQLSPRTATD